MGSQTEKNQKQLACIQHALAFAEYLLQKSKTALHKMHLKPPFALKKSLYNL
jgi:hypothetical protein